MTPDAPAAWLLSSLLERTLAALEACADEGGRERLWREADDALRRADAEEEADVALPVWERDLAAVRALVDAWRAGRAPLPAWDKAVLARAHKAFKKRLKLARLDDVSTAAANPLSSGRSSSIAGVRPPESYPPEVWQTLVRQGRLRDAGDGVLEPVGE